MWTPTNIADIPSKEDKCNALKAISLVKDQLQEARLALKQAKRSVGRLEQDLQTRQAWLAPIRFLSYDILSQIFEYCGEDDWTMTVRIAGVSQFWRQVCLATPRAWLSFNLKQFQHGPDAAKVIFKRSGQRDLHAYFPYGDLNTLLADSEISRRLVCLSVSMLPPDNSGTFPNLQRLVIRDDLVPIQSSEIDSTRFPALQHLSCAPFIGDVVPGSLGEAAEPADNMPPLQSLSLTMIDNPIWTGILQGCSETLVLLTLHVWYTTVVVFDPPLCIELPRLKSLAIHFYEGVWPMMLKTPALETYLEVHTDNRFVQFLRHFDIGLVSHISTDQQVPLPSAPHLRVLQLRTRQSLERCLVDLLRNPAQCPELELIEISTFYDEAYTYDVLNGVNKNRSQQIAFSQVPHATFEKPGAISGECGSDMPCYHV